jgi:uncharacterized protein (DUF1778 family)
MTLRIDSQDSALIKKFAKFNGLSISEFAREAMLEKIEDAADLAELRKAISEDDGTRYSIDEVAKELGIELSR